ncbi:unnamed protein product [Rangifer tarandus platyrhynchus]|uniref:Uncharacterized protein n=1 Tax=Rangifer tarandus platyrhynchus TaxID=3082113 RepID=A0AC59YTK2_RANTA
MPDGTYGLENARGGKRYVVQNVPRPPAIQLGGDTRRVSRNQQGLVFTANLERRPRLHEGLCPWLSAIMANPLQYSHLENPTDGGLGGLQSTGSRRVGHG